DRDRLVGLDPNLRQGAGHRRRDVGVHLVGADLQQRLALGDLVTDRLVPHVDGALVHRLAHSWHDYIGAHLARSSPRGVPGGRPPGLALWGFRGGLPPGLALRQAQPPLSHTFVKANAKSGSGPAFASSVARSTAALAAASIWSRTSSSTPREMSTLR